MELKDYDMIMDVKRDAGQDEIKRAGPIGKLGSSCVSGTTYHEGVCVPKSLDNNAPKSRIYNMSDGDPDSRDSSDGD